MEAKAEQEVQVARINITLLLVLCITVILSISAVSAFDWDNVKDYDKATKTVTITNSLGLGKELAKMQLISPQVNYIIEGLDRKVAEIKFLNVDKTYNEIAFRGIELTNLKTSREFSRKITYKYAVYEDVEENTYSRECSPSKDPRSKEGDEDCTSKITGTANNTRVKEWIPFTDISELPSNENVTVGLFTDVFPSDNVEWIPTFFGVKIEEWAVWTASLNIDLLAYYKLEEASGNIINSVDAGSYVMTSSLLTYQSGGKIGYGVNASNVDTIFQDNDFAGLGKQWTMSMWVKWTGAHLEQTGAFGTYSPQFSVSGATFATHMSMYWGGWQDMTTASTVGVYNHYVFARDSADNIHCYVNGVACATNFSKANALGTGLTFHSDRQTANGGATPANYDEIGIWNRTLSGAEITQLYNGGAGITYTNSFDDEYPSFNNYWDDNATKYNSGTGNFNVTLTSTNGTVIFNINNTNYTATNLTGNIFNVSVFLNNATWLYNWYSWGNGSSSFANKSVDRYYTINENSPPIITLNSPQDAMLNISNNVIFNWSATDDTNIANTTLWINGIRNITYLWGTSDTIYEQVTLTLSDGFYNWTVDAYDDIGQLTTATLRNFTIDSTNPIVNITYPINATNFAVFTEYVNITINVSAFDAGTLDTCIFYNGTGGRNVTGTCGSNYTEGFFGGTHEVEFWANDTIGHESSMNITFFVNSAGSNFTSASSLIEGQQHNVTFTITSTSITSINANVSYNDTIYPMTLVTSNSTYASFIKQLFAPYVTADTSYNISVIYDLNGVIRATSNNTQIVFNTPNINLNGTCENGFNSLYLMKFADETTKSALIVNISYNFYYGTESATEYLYGNISNTAQFSICINNTLPHLYISEGEIDYASGGYADRKYYLFEGYRYNGTSVNTTLYSLASSLATTFLFTVQDNQFNVQTGKYLSLLRWYPELNSYNVVDIGKTDDKGQTVGKVKVEDVDYRIGVYEKNGSLMQLFNAIRFVCSSTPCSYSIFLPSATESYVNLDGLQHTLVFNKASKVFIYNYNDVSQATTSMNLSVFKDAYGSSNLICVNTASGFTGVITCNVSAYSGTLRAVVYRSSSPAMPLISLIVNTASKLVDIAGGKTIGLLMSFVLFTFAFLVGIFSPIVAMVLGIVALIPALYFGAISTTVFVGIILLTGLLIHFLRRS